MNTAIEQYIHELSDLLCCDKTTKQQFLSKFQQTLEDFEAEQENSPISYSDLVSEFDTPRATADAFLSQLDISHVQPAMRTTNKKKKPYTEVYVFRGEKMLDFIKNQIEADTK